jgi:hypothetical protein
VVCINIKRFINNLSIKLLLCFILEGNNDLNTLKIVKVYIQLIQEGLINMNHLINLLQFVKMVYYIIKF